MLNFYSCGCTAQGDVPAISRCAEHNGWIVATVKNEVTKKQMVKANGTTLAHAPVEEVLQKCIERKMHFDLICSFPEHAVFYAMNSVLQDAWRQKINPIMPLLYQCLSKKGHMVFIVEQSLLARLLYDGAMAGFEINSTTLISSSIKEEPLYKQKFPELHVYKFAVVFSKGGKYSLPDFLPLRKLARRLARLEPRRVLDISCIHTPFLELGERRVGICENYQRYSKLKRELM